MTGKTHKAKRDTRLGHKSALRDHLLFEVDLVFTEMYPRLTAGMPNDAARRELYEHIFALGAMAMYESILRAQEAPARRHGASLTNAERTRKKKEKVRGYLDWCKANHKPRDKRTAREYLSRTDPTWNDGPEREQAGKVETLLRQARDLKAPPRK